MLEVENVDLELPHNDLDNSDTSLHNDLANNSVITSHKVGNEVVVLLNKTKGFIFFIKDKIP